jgi:flagellar basal body P-ring formation protein FlgA
MFPRPKPRSRRHALAILFAPVLLWQAGACPAFAQEKTAPVPTQVIYPGDIIREGMLTDVPVDDLAGRGGPFADTHAALVGKLAKRTLLPGRLIAMIAVENPRAVSNGAQIKLVYRDGPLIIVTFAMALDNGAVGDTIRVRNADSGTIISGVILPDGTVSVSDS